MTALTKTKRKNYYPTPFADEALQMFTLKTDQVNLNEEATEGQKVIMETILGRKAPDGTGRKRVHILAHTRFGKSMAIAAALAIRASMKGEPWVIVAPTKEQAQIIMDYCIEIAINDPIISQLLRDDVAKAIKKERLTQRRSRNHITFLKGGEIRTFAAKGTMGFGSKNVILDEAGLINNQYESKVFRMLGDDTDNFYVKIGNPWTSIDENGEEHHFRSSFTDPTYFSVNYDYKDGLEMGRLTEDFLEEVRKKPNFDVLYENIYPDEDVADKDKYLPLFTHKMLKRAVVGLGVMEMAGDIITGADPADGGDNEAVICHRGMNLAVLAFTSTDIDSVGFATDIIQTSSGSGSWNIDKQGAGSGTVRTLERNASFSDRVNPINSGLPVPDYVDNADGYSNLRAYIFWAAAAWIKGGGRLEGDMTDWKQLLAVRWKNNEKGKVKIISKDELHKRKVHDLGRADAFSYTFAPKKRKMNITKVTGGVQPFYSSMPDTPRGSEGEQQAAPRGKFKNRPYYPKTSY